VRAIVFLSASVRGWLAPELFYVSVSCNNSKLPQLRLRGYNAGVVGLTFVTLFGAQG